VPDPPAGGDVLHGGARHGRAKGAANAVEPQRPQVGHRVQAQHLVKAVLQRAPAHPQFAAQVFDAQRLVDVLTHVFLRAADQCVAARRPGRRHALVGGNRESVDDAAVDRLLERAPGDRVLQLLRMPADRFERQQQERAQAPHALGSRRSHRYAAQVVVDVALVDLQRVAAQRVDRDRQSDQVQRRRRAEVEMAPIAQHQHGVEADRPTVEIALALQPDRHAEHVGAGTPGAQFVHRLIRRLAKQLDAREQRFAQEALEGPRGELLVGLVPAAQVSGVLVRIARAHPGERIIVALGLRRGPLADAHRRRSPRLPADAETLDGRNCPERGRETTTGSRLDPVSARLASRKSPTRCILQPIFDGERKVGSAAPDCRFRLTHRRKRLLESLRVDEESTERGVFP